ncbi:MAG: ABC transporter transmembrane domain-containing protein [Waterburya sp.]
MDRQFKKAFNNIISNSERDFVYQKLKIIEPNPGQPFWSSENVEAVVYFTLAGKVRLLDQEGNLIVSLPEGSIFGQISLFPEAKPKLRPHAVRAGLGLKLGYLDAQALRELLRRSPEIEKCFYAQALKWDLLLLNQQTDNRDSVQNLLSILPLLQQDNLAVGTIPSHLLQNQDGCWLLRQGNIIHSSGFKITPGKIYDLAQFPQGGEWLVNQPTELYSFDPAARQSLLPASPIPQTNLAQLEKLAGSKTVNLDNSEIKPNLIRDQDRGRKLYFPSPQVRFSQWWQGLTKRYPFRKQQSKSDCGVACLVMIGQYWGKDFSISQLRSVANVDRSGASIKGLITASEYLGFAPRPVQADLKALAKQKLPAIAHWKGNHYVVVYRITRERVIIADPSIGRRSLTRQEFVQDWKGYTLLLTPTAKFKQAPEAKRNLGKYLDLLKPYRLVLFEVLAASLMIQIVGLFTPILTQILLDRVIVQRSTSTLIAIGSGLIIFSLFNIAMSSVRRYLLYHTANKLDLSLIIGFINHTLRLPLGYFETRYVGDITSRISENRKIRRFITGEAITTLLDVFSVFVYIGLMFWYSWKLSFLALIVIPIFAFVTLVFTPLLLRISRENFTAETKERSYLIEALSGIGTIKSMGVERNVRWRWEDLLNESVRINLSGRMIFERLSVSTSLVQALTSQFTLIFGVWLVIQDQLTIGQLIAFNMLVGNVVQPFQRLIALWSDFQEILVAVERLDDVIDSPPEEDWSAGNLPALPAIKGKIRFEKVTFRYNLESEVNTIENLSFEVNPGQTIAIVGRSGSGKTTISKLLLGLYIPTEGKILIDEQEINTISLQSLRKQAGVVDQDTFLFGGTILENLTIAHPNAPLTEVKRVCSIAGAAEFIETFPLKYDTKIGEGGSLLSGGQKQRLAIARALLGNPRLLILDEATSSLDAESERIIQNNFNTILKNQTTLIIAHRLSTVRNADLILVMDRGLLVESGTHQELMARKGQYYYLNQQQLAVSN